MEYRPEPPDDKPPVVPLPELSERLAPQDRDHQAALLDCFKRNAAQPYPHYPQTQDRLYIPEGELRFDEQGRLILPFEPDKPYTVHNHPDNVAGRANGKALADIGQTLSDSEAARFREEGYELTDRNFPLHPLWRSMLTNPDIGTVDSLGYYWQPGLNETTDVVAIAPVKIDDGPLCLQGLFALRDDTRQWALAGGDIDSGETPLGAALRETAEETHVDLSAAEPTPLTRQIVADPRTTLVTGAITQPFLCMLPELPAQTPRAGDETSAAAWRPVTSKFLGELFAPHNLIVEEAVRAYEQTHGVTVLQNGRIVRDPKA